MNSVRHVSPYSTSAHAGYLRLKGRGLCAVAALGAVFSACHDGALTPVNTSPVTSEVPAADAGMGDGGGRLGAPSSQSSRPEPSAATDSSLSSSSHRLSTESDASSEASSGLDDSTAATSTGAWSSAPDDGGMPNEGDAGIGNLTSLTVGGTLRPAFDVDTHEYEVLLPGFIQQLSLTADAESGATVTVNGQPVDTRGRWASEKLGTAAESFVVEVRHGGNMGHTYRLTTRRKELSQTYLGNPDPERESYGRHNALNYDGDLVIVGGSRAPLDEQAGVHAYRRSGETWSKSAYIEHPPPATGDHREWYLSLSDDGNTLLAGVPNIREFVPVGEGMNAYQGGAYVFHQVNGQWSWQTDITLADGKTEDRFGMGVAMAGDGKSLAITAPRWLQDREPLVYLYQRQGDGWTPANPPSLPLAPPSYEAECIVTHTGVGLNKTGDVLVTVVVGDYLQGCDTRVRVHTRQATPDGAEATWSTSEFPGITPSWLGLLGPTIDLSADGKQFLVASASAGGYFEHDGIGWVTNGFGPSDAALSDSGYYMATTYGIYLRVPSGWELQWTLPNAMTLGANVERGVALSGDGSTAAYGPVIIR